MILDRIEHFQQYTRCVPQLYDVIKFAKRAEAENLPAGKYSLGNQDFVLIQERNTRRFEDADFEVHRKYLDVQIIISGSEYMEYADISELKEKIPFDADADLALMEGSGTRIQIKPGMFYLLYPADGHKPCCHETVPTTYKKVLAKIKIDKLIHRVELPRV